MFFFCAFNDKIIEMKRKNGLDFNRRRRKKVNITVFKEIGGFAFWIAISVFLALVLNYEFGLRTNVIGNSMEPGLVSGQQILVDRLIYSVSEPSYKDVIAFVPNGNEKSHYYIKRVIGVPGDTVKICDGYVYINGEKLDEGDEYDKIANAGIAESEIYLGAEEYFVLGDNRNFSEDSRFGNIGIVNKSFIIGKVWFKLSDNLEHIGFVK